MPIPSYEKMMSPLLEYLGDKREHKLNDLVEHIYKVFNVTEKKKSFSQAEMNRLLITELDGLGYILKEQDYWNQQKEARAS